MPTTTSPRAIYAKLAELEDELQQTKLEAYFALPEKKLTIERYPEKILMSALKNTRRNIWNKRYAKKIARVR